MPVENLAIRRFEDLLKPKGSRNLIQAYKDVLWLHTTDVAEVWVLNTSSLSVVVQRARASRKSRWEI